MGETVLIMSKILTLKILEFFGPETSETLKELIIIVCEVPYVLSSIVDVSFKLIVDVPVILIIIGDVPY